MNGITLTGVVLMVLGGLALVYQGFNYTRQRNVVDLGPIHATVESREHVPLPPIAGGIALAAGAVLLAMGVGKK
jgi:hypothetical protein